MSTYGRLETEFSSMTITDTDIEGLRIITPTEARDQRGIVREIFRASSFSAVGLQGFGHWKQINVTETRKGAIRGLHGEDMCKLVTMIHGTAFGAWVDLRPKSPSLGNVVTANIDIGIQVLVPNGVCNGYQSTSEGLSQYMYCFDREWTPGMVGHAVNPLDPELAIDWPITIDPLNSGLLSDKDRNGPTFREALEIAARPARSGRRA